METTTIKQSKNEFIDTIAKTIDRICETPEDVQRLMEYFEAAKCAFASIVSHGDDTLNRAQTIIDGIREIHKNHESEDIEYNVCDAALGYIQFAGIARKYQNEIFDFEF